MHALWLEQSGVRRGLADDADAFHSLQLDRRAALWRSLDCQESATFIHEGIDTNEPENVLVALPAVQEVLADYRNVGLSLKGHPMQFLRERLEYGVVLAAALAALPNDRWLRVAGLVLVRQRPGTASGITFVTLEDETGQANLIVRPHVWDRYHVAARNAAILVAHGRLQREGLVIHVLTHQAWKT